MEMTPENWDKAKELFEAALALDSSQRASFLAGNCRDQGLQQQVEMLLTNYQEAGNFLDPVLDPRFLATATSAEAKDAMLGRRLGAYKLVRRVGQGGMAAVFLAVRADDEYQKEVAVKVVQPGLDSQDLLSRFRNERQTLAGLDHPNIVKLLDGGSTPEGLPFLVMEYVEGSPIVEYCDHHKLSVDERLRLFGEVCDAVQYAHEKLVIHRDLKPSNILVAADSTPKLLDFGIAKVLNTEPSARALLVTQTGSRCMTPAYASPEQIRGKPVTTETDIYSLGVVLYELLTGHRPYRLTQHTPSEIERAICEQEPEKPSSVLSRVETDTSSDGRSVVLTPDLVSLTREGQPEKLRRRLRGDLDNIVLKALQKEPQRRYGSVAEFSEDIDRHLQHLPITARPSTLAYRLSKHAQRHKVELSAAFTVLVVIAAASVAFNTFGLRNRLAKEPSHSRIHSLAVLPLQDLSADPAQEYFSDGMTDALITDLAQIGSVKVISRTSSMQYKQTKKSLPEIAHELNVDGIIEGTVQRSGDRIRITAQLIYGPSDKHLWARSYEEELRDVFDLQKNVASDIAQQVQAKLTPQSASPQPRPVDPKVLDAYIQGNYYLSGSSRGAGDEDKKKARKYFQQAIDLDPDFAPAYIGLAQSHELLLQGEPGDLVVVKKAAQKALELDPTSSGARMELAEIKWSLWDWSGAEEDYRRVLALYPNNAEAHDMLASILDVTGRLDEGWKEYQIAQELDPNHDHLAQALYQRGQFDRAIEIFQRVAKRDPTDGGNHYALALAYAQKGLYKQYVEEMSTMAPLFGVPEVGAHLQEAYAKSGYQGALRQWAKELEYLAAHKQGYYPGALAQAYAALGDKDRAFYWLDQYSQHRDLASAEPTIYFKTDPWFAPLRSDPRFADFLRRVGLSP